MTDTLFTQETEERSRNEILGMQVLSINEGIPLGQVRQILLDPETHHVLGFLVERNRYGREERILPFAAVSSFGTDSITVESQSLLERRGNDHRYIRALRQPVQIVGVRAFTANGRTLGKIEEYRFSATDGSLSTLEISGGLFRERMLVPGQDLIAISPQVAMLRDSAMEHATELAERKAAEKDSGRTGGFKEATFGSMKKFASDLGESVSKLFIREEDEEEEYAEPKQVKAASISADDPIEAVTADTADLPTAKDEKKEALNDSVAE